MDITFIETKLVTDSKRRSLQRCSNKRKVSVQTLTLEEIRMMVDIWRKDNREGLQQNLVYVHKCAFQLTWRDNEPTNCKINLYQN